jgi:hypothetical protein
VKPIVDDREPMIRPGALPPKYGRAVGRSLAGGSKRKRRQGRRRQRQ